MATQLLVNVISATVPAGASSYPVAHGLISNQQAVAPTLVMPKAQSAVTVQAVDENNVYLANPSGAPVEVTFRVERGLSNEVNAETLPLFIQSTGDGGTGPMTEVSVTAPITNSGTSTAPNIGLNTAMGGDLDGSYPNPTLKTLSPSPAGTYGSASSIPVVTVSGSGLVTGVSTAPAAAMYLNASIAITSGDFTTSPVYLTPTPSALVIPAGRRVTYGVQFANGYIQNNAVNPVSVTARITDAAGTVTLAMQTTWIPAGAKMSLPNISFTFPNFSDKNIPDVRLELTLGGGAVDGSLVLYSFPNEVFMQALT